MLRFYDVDPSYANYLRVYDKKVPNITYAGNNKFVCGVVLTINSYEYFAPISSQSAKQQTSLQIKDSNNKVVAAIKFSFMFPAPNSVLTLKDFRMIRKQDPSYAGLLTEEFEYCRKHEDIIRQKAANVYKIGCNPSHILFPHCCDFKLLELKYNEWIMR